MLNIDWNLVETGEFDTRLSKLVEILKDIKEPSVRNLIIDVLNSHSDYDKVNNSIEIIELLEFLLEEKGLIIKGHDSFRPAYIDLLIASCLLYNISKDLTSFDDWLKIYEPRILISNIHKENYRMIPQDAIDMICDTIENQLGGRTPIKGSRPNANTPSELFYYAVVITNKYKK